MPNAVETFQWTQKQLHGSMSIKNGESVTMLEFWSWTLYFLFLARETSTIIPSAINFYSLLIL